MNDTLKVASDFFDRKIGAMVKTGGNLADAEFDDIDREDRSVVYMMRRLHFGECLAVRKYPREQQYENFSRNIEAVINLVQEADHRKAPMPITYFAEVCVASITMAHFLMEDGKATPVSEAIWAKSGVAMHHFINQNLRFTGLPTVMCDLLDSRLLPDAMDASAGIVAGCELGLTHGMAGTLVDGFGAPAPRDLAMALGVVIGGVFLADAWDSVCADGVRHAWGASIQAAVRRRTKAAIGYVLDQGYQIKDLSPAIDEFLAGILAAED